MCTSVLSPNDGKYKVRSQKTDSHGVQRHGSMIAHRDYKKVGTGHIVHPNTRAHYATDLVHTKRTRVLCWCVRRTEEWMGKARSAHDNSNENVRKHACDPQECEDATDVLTFLVRSQRYPNGFRSS
jgi:hypothetical protein